MLIVIRGVPGSGKSTEAERLKNYYLGLGANVTICSNDNYPGYYESGEYEWTPSRAKLASQWCWNEFSKCVEKQDKVIILDNTNLSYKSYGRYQRLAEICGHEICFVEFRPPINNAVALEEYIQICSKRNKHKVSYGIIKNMVEAWVDQDEKSKGI